MTQRKGAKHWANDLTVILNARGGNERFPVDVRQLAYDYTKQVRTAVRKSATVAAG